MNAPYDPLTAVSEGGEGEIPEIVSTGVRERAPADSWFVYLLIGAVAGLIAEEIL